MQMLRTTVQPTDHQNHSTVTVHSPSLKQKVHRAALYCIGGGPGFSKYSIFTAEYYAVDSNTTFNDKLSLIYHILYQNLKGVYHRYHIVLKKSHCFQ